MINRSLFPLEKWKELPDCLVIGLERLLIQEKSRALKLLKGKEDFVQSIFRDSLEMLRLYRIKNKDKKCRETTSSTLEFLRKNNFQTWRDKLSSCKNIQSQKALTTLLFKILDRELILKEKDYKPFWNNACVGLSATLPSPIETVCQDLDLSLLNGSSQRQVEQSRLLTIKTINLQNRNWRKTCSASCISTVASKWEEDPISSEVQHKTLVLDFKPTDNQKVLLDQNLKCSNYVYNKTIAKINRIRKNKERMPSKLDLRNSLVTLETRKANVLFNKVSKAKKLINEEVKHLIKSKKLKNIITAMMIKKKYLIPVSHWLLLIKLEVKPVRQNLKPWEISTHKEIREEAVFEAKKNYDTCMTKLKKRDIKFFKLKFRTSKKQVMSITKSMVKLEDGKLRLTDKNLSKDDKTIRMANRSLKKLRGISEFLNSTITKTNGVYKIHIPVKYSVPLFDTSNIRICGIDPGVKTFLSIYGIEESRKNISLTEICHSDRIKSCFVLREAMKKSRKSKQRKRIKRRTLLKKDRLESNLVNDLHWKSINHIVKNYDLIFLEKFGSHKLVKASNSRAGNRNILTLKPFQFRQKLMYKANSLGKKVEIVASQNTTKTCSSCGNLQSMNLSDRVYKCSGCEDILNRDMNSAKNMILRGLCS